MYGLKYGVQSGSSIGGFVNRLLSSSRQWGSWGVTISVGVM